MPVLIGVAMFEEDGNEGVAFVLNLTERKRAEAEAREMQMELAHANRVATVGQLTASIAHEINQPIGATVTNAQAALRWLRAEPPNLEALGRALDRIVQDGNRAGSIIHQIRALIKKAPPRLESLAINDAILEIIAVTRSEVTKQGITLRTQLAQGLPDIQGDRVQLQQVVLNLILNAIEAMSQTSDGIRDLFISSAADGDGVQVTVRDSGPASSPASSNMSSSRFTAPSPRASEWASQSAARSSTCTGDDYGPRSMNRRARFFDSRYGRKTMLNRRDNTKLNRRSLLAASAATLAIPADALTPRPSFGRFLAAAH